MNQHSDGSPRRLVDLSHPLSAQTPVYPGDDGVQITVLDVASEPPAGGERRLNNSRLSLGLHQGTHIDAPFHFFSDRATIDRVSLQQCYGPAVCLDLTRTARPGVIDGNDLLPHASRCSTVTLVLLHTGWSRRWRHPDYFESHPVLTAGAAEQLVHWGVRLVGVDFPSVDRPPFEAHLVLLGHDVLIVENLTNLADLPASAFDFVAVPLAVESRDASPVRAFAVCHEA